MSSCILYPVSIRCSSVFPLYVYLICLLNLNPYLVGKAHDIHDISSGKTVLVCRILTLSVFMVSQFFPRFGFMLKLECPLKALPSAKGFK